LTQNKPQKWFI